MPQNKLCEPCTVLFLFLLLILTQRHVSFVLPSSIRHCIPPSETIHTHLRPHIHSHSSLTHLPLHCWRNDALIHMFLNLLATALVLCILGVVFLLVAYVVSPILWHECNKLLCIGMLLCVRTFSLIYSHTTAIVLFQLASCPPLDSAGHSSLHPMDSSLLGVRPLASTPKPCQTTHTRGIHSETYVC